MRQTREERHAPEDHEHQPENAEQREHRRREQHGQQQADRHDHDTEATAIGRHLDAPARETDQRRQQRDRRDHHREHAERGTGREAPHERQADHVQPEQRDDDGRTREQHGPAGGVDGRGDRVLGFHPLVQVLAIAGDDEQRVVDTDPEPDHRGHLRREVRHVLEPAEQGGQRDCGAEAEQRGADRQAHGDHRTERDQQNDHRGEETEQLAGRQRERAEHVAAVLDRHALDGDVVSPIFLMSFASLSVS